MKNKIMGILLSVTMVTSSLCMASVSAADFSGDTEPLILDMTEDEEALEVEEEVPDEDMVEVGDADLEEGEAPAEEEEPSESGMSVEEFSAFDDGTSAVGDSADVTELELDKTVEVKVESGKYYIQKYFSFTPADSGFYRVDYTGGNLQDGYTEFTAGSDKKAVLFWDNSPYLIKGVRYSFSFYVSAITGDGVGSVKISPVGNSTDAYEKYVSAGKPADGNIIWTVSEGILDVQGTGEVPRLTLRYITSLVQQIRIEEGITKIAYNAFSGLNETTKVTLPSSLEEIGNNAFSGLSQLGEVIIPENSKLKKIGSDAFWDTALTRSQSGDYVMLGDIVLKYRGNNLKTTIPESAGFLSSGFVSRGNILEEIDLSGNLKSVAEQSVSGCENLKKIKVGSNVTTVEYAAFVSNTALEAAELDEGVEEIGEEAFLDCPKLKKINIPKSVTSVGKHAVGYSRYVTESTYLGHPVADDKYVSIKYAEEDRPVITCWYGTAGYDYAVSEEMPYELLDAKNLSNTEISKVNVEQDTSSGLKVQVTVKFGENVLKEGRDYTWRSTLSEDGRQLKISVKGCGEYFGIYETTVENKGYKPAEDTKAPTVTPGQQKPGNNTSSDPAIKSLKKGTVFKAGTAKYKVTGANTVAYAGTTSKKAKKITIGNTVTYQGVTYNITSIAAKALKNNKKITQVTVGANVTYIGASAFQGCGKLTRITVKSKVLKTVKSKAFKGISKKAKIKVPASKLKTYRKLLKKKGQSTGVRITK